MVELLLSSNDFVTTLFYFVCLLARLLASSCFFLFVSLFLCYLFLFISLFVCLFVCLLVCVFVYWFVYLFVSFMCRVSHLMFIGLSPHLVPSSFS
jgi:hypothetical protein